jgi:hypothetical protein
MLVIQSGYKTDLETNRSIFILYLQLDGGVTYNCSLDYNIIKNAQKPEDVINAIVPLLQNLCGIAFAKPPQYLSQEEENRKNELIRLSVSGLNEEQKQELMDLISKSNGFKKPEEVKIESKPNSQDGEAQTLQ